MATKQKDPKYRVRWIREEWPESYGGVDREVAERIAEILRKSEKNSGVGVYLDDGKI